MSVKDIRFDVKAREKLLTGVNMLAGAKGFNAATEEYEDLIEAGIIDPTKVTRTALQNAASVASMLLTTECLIADKPEKAKNLQSEAYY